MIMYDNLKMRCPCCNREMKNKSKYETSRIIDFSGTCDEDYETRLVKKYKCEDCNIKWKDDEWKIPKKYERPTQKQINTIRFINNTLNLDIEPLLKIQCQREISKYFNEAKKAKKAQQEQYFQDIQEEYGEFDYY